MSKQNFLAYLLTKAQSAIELYVKIFFRKISILDVWQGSEYTSCLYKCHCQDENLQLEILQKK